MEKPEIRLPRHSKMPEPMVIKICTRYYVVDRYTAMQNFITIILGNFDSHGPHIRIWLPSVHYVTFFWVLNF